MMPDTAAGHFRGAEFRTMRLPPTSVHGETTTMHDTYRTANRLSHAPLAALDGVAKHITAALTKVLRFPPGHAGRGGRAHTLAGMWVGLLAITLLTSPAQAQTAPYPSRPIKLISPLGAGGATDVVARVIAAKMSERLGQTMFVENRPGAEGAIGVDAGAKAAPDGYTLVLGSSTTLAANYYLRKLPYDPVKDLEPVSMLLKNFYNVIVVNPQVPANNLKELIALAKTMPGKLNYGTGTSGSKICMEMLKSAAGIDLQMVNYKSSAQALNDVLGGQVQVVCEPVAIALPHIEAGRLKGMGVTSLTRYAGAPKLTTVVEEGIPGFEYAAWLGAFAPAGTPKDIVEKLSKEFAIVLRDPETVQKILAAGAEPMIGGPAELAALLKTEMTRAGDVVHKAGIKPE